MPSLSWEILTIHTTVPFVIARGGASDHRVVKVTLRDADGAFGWGEASPNRFYGETPETAVAALERLRPIVEACDPFLLETLEAQMNAALRNNGSVKSAVSAAAHDLVGKRLGVPLWKLWGLDPAKAPASSFTIAIAPDNAELVRRVQAAADYPVLKVKLGTDRDEEIIRTVREAAPDKVIRVDANAAWTPKHALAMIELLQTLGVEYVEQPVAAADLDGLGFVRQRSSLPIIADESCVVSADVARLAGLVDGINIKLSKCGGLREALRMIATARAHGMLVMAGCMIETSLAITAAAHFAPLLDYADFDGAALLSDDPHVGATITGGRIAIPNEPGLGVRMRS
ncbi:MAG TPA: dipeptide epimerase [Gemmatimonadaceae bacterium]|nr:dipeptide epimerase [Gemmatimonadaceae bacterium]